MAELSYTAFIARVAKCLACSEPYARSLVQAVVGTLTMSIALGDRVCLPGLGTFGHRRAGQRSGRLPDGSPCRTSSVAAPSWRPAEDLRRKVRRLGV